MPKFTPEENKRLALLNTKKFLTDNKTAVEEEIAQIYHEAERREDLKLQKANIDEAKKANRLSKIAIGISLVSLIAAILIGIFT